MTHPHRWLRAAHKIAPNGALFPDISCYRSGSTERSRPFPTNLPKVRNHPVRFIDKLTAPLPKGSGAAFIILLYTQNSTPLSYSVTYPLSCRFVRRHRAATKAKIPPATTKTAKILPRCFISLPSRFAPVIFLPILYHKKHAVASKLHTLQHLRKTLHKLRIPIFSDVLHKIALT